MSSYVDLLQEYREKFDKEIFPLLVSHELIHITFQLASHFKKELTDAESKKNQLKVK